MWWCYQRNTSRNGGPMLGRWGSSAKHRKGEGDLKSRCESWRETWRDKKKTLKHPSFLKSQKPRIGNRKWRALPSQSYNLPHRTRSGRVQMWIIIAHLTVISAAVHHRFTQSIQHPQGTWKTVKRIIRLWIRSCRKQRISSTCSLPLDRTIVILPTDRFPVKESYKRYE